MNKFLNINISQELTNLLLTTIPFKNNWKAISPAYYFMERISTLNEYNNGNPSEFYSTTIMNDFKHYTKGEYKIYLTTLKELGLLFIDEYYSDPKINNGISECKKYLITQKGLDFIKDSNKIWLSNYYHDLNNIKRTNQKSISKRKVMKKMYENPFLNHMNDVRNNTKFNLNNIIEKDLIKNTSDSINVKKIITKDFSDLKYNVSDGRVWSETIQLSNIIKNEMIIKGKERKVVIDIRACHPTFWSIYLLTYYKTNYNILCSLVHPVTEKGDILDFEASLETENQVFIDLFTSETDPRLIISQELNIPYELTKDCLNKAINGSMEPFCRKIDMWLMDKFPNLYKIWLQTDKKQTGNQIAKLFECPMMQNMEIINIIKTMNIITNYEYDGMSLFCEENESEEKLSSKVNFIIKLLYDYSIKNFGLKTFIKIKWLDNEVDFLKLSLTHEYDKKKSELETELFEKTNCWNYHRRHTFSLKDKATEKDWEQFNKAKNEYKKVKNELGMLEYDFNCGLIELD